MRDLVMSAAELERFLHEHMPAAATTYRVELADESGVRIRVGFHDGQLRPGGTVSGPTLMAAADTAAWLATLAHIGPEALSVTSSLNIAFLAKPQPADLLAHAGLLRLGRRQSVSEVRLWSDGGSAAEPVAHATVTYAIPTPR